MTVPPVAMATAEAIRRIMRYMISNAFEKNTEYGWKNRSIHSR